MELAGRRGVSPSEVVKGWDEYELREYAVWRAREPSLEDRVDFWSAHILAALINPYRKKGARAVNGADLIPDRWKARKGPKSVGDWKELLKGMALAFRGKVN